MEIDAAVRNRRTLGERSNLSAMIVDRGSEQKLQSKLNLVVS